MLITNIKTMSAAGPTIKRGQSSGDIWTPWEFIRAVEEKFGRLAIDLCASGVESAKAARWITPARDSLAQDWAILLGGGLGWDNCPFDNIRPWAAKHVFEREQGAKMLLLVPASVGANWYWDFVEPYSDVYSVGRMVFDNCFDKQGKLVTTPYPKDLILCHYYPGSPKSKMQRWQWKARV